MADIAHDVSRLYCYVDETGQDTTGRLFIVVAAIIGEDRENLRNTLCGVESASGKGHKKWTKATRQQRHSYLSMVFSSNAFQNRLYYGSFARVTDYLPCVLSTIASSLAAASAGKNYKATVLIDGLGKSERHRVGGGLHKLRVRTEKVRGLRDQSDEFIRLADAVAGCVRESLEQKSESAQLIETACLRAILREVLGSGLH